MEVILKGTPEEIAALVVAIQERRVNVDMEINSDFVRAVHAIVRRKTDRKEEPQ